MEHQHTGQFLRQSLPGRRCRTSRLCATHRACRFLAQQLSASRHSRTGWCLRGGASFDSDSGAFRFYSYRDPRLAETLADFDASIDWLLNEQHETRLLEEAILGVIAGIDKPASPAGEAKKAFHAALHGRTPEQRRRFRSRVLEVSEADLKRVASTYLKAERATTAVVSNPSTLAQSGLGLEIITL